MSSVLGFIHLTSKVRHKMYCLLNQFSFLIFTCYVVGCVRLILIKLLNDLPNEENWFILCQTKPNYFPASDLGKQP